MKLHELFSKYCDEERPLGWSPRSNVGDRHVELESALYHSLFAEPLASATRDNIISLKNRLRDAAECENQAIKEYEARLIDIADALLSGSA
jgi:hypothetical protein